MDYDDVYTEHMLNRMGLLDPTKTSDPPLPPSKGKETNPPENAELAALFQHDVLMSRDNENNESEVALADPLVFPSHIALTLLF
eukprot:5843383-Ditylum_brightwellii.AAC.1